MNKAGVRQLWGEKSPVREEPWRGREARLVHLIDLVSERSLSFRQKNLRNFPEGQGGSC